MVEEVKMVEEEEKRGRTRREEYMRYTPYLFKEL